jgi:hypothetical protein
MCKFVPTNEIPIQKSEKASLTVTSSTNGGGCWVALCTMMDVLVVSGK